MQLTDVYYYLIFQRRNPRAIFVLSSTRLFSLKCYPTKIVSTSTKK